MAHFTFFIQDVRMEGVGGMQPWVSCYPGLQPVDRACRQGWLYRPTMWLQAYGLHVSSTLHWDEWTRYLVTCTTYRSEANL